MSNYKLRELHARVYDKATFLEFAWALHRDAEVAEEEASSDPLVKAYGAPRDWQNLSVSTYLGAILAQLAESNAELSWKLLADVMWLGKIME